MAATCPSMFQELGSIWMSTCSLVSIFQLEKEKRVSHVQTFADGSGDDVRDEVADESDEVPVEIAEMSSHGFQEYILYKISSAILSMAV